MFQIWIKILHEVTSDTDDPILIIHVCDGGDDEQAKKVFSAFLICVFTCCDKNRTTVMWPATGFGLQFSLCSTVIRLSNISRPSMLFLTVRTQPGRSLIFNVKILLVSICFSVFHQWTQLDEKYMYGVMLHKAVNPLTRMMKISWAQRQSFNFCSKPSPAAPETREQMKEWRKHWAGLYSQPLSWYQPSCGALCN